MAKTIRLSDIAEVVGVSVVTVSNALSDKGGVSNELRLKIKEVADGMGYTPLSVNKGSSSRKTGNIGVLIPESYFDMQDSFYWKLYQEILSELSERRYYAILEIIPKEMEIGLQEPNLIRDQKVDGVIALGQMCSEFEAWLINDSGVPAFFIDTYSSMPGFDTVISNGFYGMYLLTGYLIQMGHREIAYVGTVAATSSISDRYWGYRKALLENDIEFQPEWEIPDRDLSGRTFKELRFPEVMPTALVCNCDLMANLAIMQLENQGLRVPEDISIVGFDNYVHAELNYPRITTYDVNMGNMARLCVKLLLKKMNGEDYAQGIQIVTGNVVHKKSVQKLNR